MSGIFSRPGFKALKIAYGLTVVGMVLAGLLVGASYFYLQQEKKNDAASRRLLSELSGRLDGARRERNLLKDSAQLFTDLQSQGLFLPEQRLEMIETMDALKSRHKLVGLEYELMPQRALKMADNSSYSEIGINASRIKMKIRAMHDGDLLSFLDEFPRMTRGFFPVESCAIQRKSDTLQQSGAAAIAGVGLGGVIDKVMEAAKPATSAIATPVVPVLVPGLEAECALDWITLSEKAGGATQPARKP